MRTKASILNSMYSQKSNEIGFGKNSTINSRNVPFKVKPEDYSKHNRFMYRHNSMSVGAADYELVPSASSMYFNNTKKT